MLLYESTGSGLLYPPRTQIIGFIEPKYYTINDTWALKPDYLGPWTLRDRYSTVLFFPRLPVTQQYYAGLGVNAGQNLS